MSVHQLTDTHPQPSGWRAWCTCGWSTRGRDEDEVMAAFLFHAEADHLLTVEPVDGTT